MRRRCSIVRYTHMSQCGPHTLSCLVLNPILLVTLLLQLFVRNSLVALRCDCHSACCFDWVWLPHEKCSVVLLTLKVVQIGLKGFSASYFQLILVSLLITLLQLLYRHVLALDAKPLFSSFVVCSLMAFFLIFSEC